MSLVRSQVAPTKTMISHDIEYYNLTYKSLKVARGLRTAESSISP